MVFRVKDELTFMKIDGTFYFRGGTFNITKNSLRLRAHSFNVGTFLSRSIASTFFNFPWRLFKIKINLTTPQNQTQPPLTLPLTHPTLPTPNLYNPSIININISLNKKVTEFLVGSVSGECFVKILEVGEMWKGVCESGFYFEWAKSEN